MKLRRILTTSSLMLISGAVYAQYDTIVMCRACPVGTWGNGGNTECTQCSKGTYQDEMGKNSCKNCGKGKYQDLTGQTGCKNCGKGYYCPNEATENHKPVDPGYCAKTENESLQTACQSSTTSSLPGVKSCNKETCNAVTCNDGYYLTGTTCTRCPAGSWCKDNAIHDCGHGYYSEAGWSGCKECKAATGFGSWYNRDSSSYGTSCGNVRRSATAYCNGNNSTKIDADPYTSYEDKTLTCGSNSYCYNGSCNNCHNVNNGYYNVHQTSTYTGSCEYKCSSGYSYGYNDFGESSSSDIYGCCKIGQTPGTGGRVSTSCSRYCVGHNELKNDTCVPCDLPSNAHWTITSNLLTSHSCDWKCDTGREEWNGECLEKCPSGKERGTGGRCVKK